MCQESNNVKQTLGMWNKMVKYYNMEGDAKILTWPAKTTTNLNKEIIILVSDSGGTRV